MLNFNVLQRTLTDIRDGETYRVRKLADGNVWMTENLRKEFTAGEVLKPETTDVQANTTVDLATQPYNQSSTNYYNWGSGVNGVTNQTKESLERWLSRSTKKEGIWATETNPTDSSVNKTDMTGEDQKIGVYYNFYTASAGTGKYELTERPATSSICPKNWKLPNNAYGSPLSMRSLIKNTYHIISDDIAWDSDANLEALNAFPFSIPFAGGINYVNGAIGGQKTSTGLHSSYMTAGTNSKYVFIGWSNSRKLISAFEGDGRGAGRSIRCVATR